MTSWSDAYVNGLALGAFVAFTRSIYYAGRYARWTEWVGATLLCIVTSIFAMLGVEVWYGQAWISTHSSAVILSGGTAAWFGPELPAVASTTLRVAIRVALDQLRHALGTGGGDGDDPPRAA
jgi:putative effector of murein hydrolase